MTKVKFNVKGKFNVLIAFYFQHWYGIVNNHLQDDFSETRKIVFLQNEVFPADHKSLNYFYCKVS